MGVEQATVSRWERSVTKPDLWARRRIRDMLHRMEPAIDPVCIEAMSVPAIMHCTLSPPGLVCAASQKMAIDYDRKPEDMRYANIASLWPDSVREMHETLEDMDAWRSGDTVLVRAKIFRINHQWADTTGMRMDGASLVLFTMSKTEPPPGLDPTPCDLTIITKDEMIS